MASFEESSRESGEGGSVSVTFRDDLGIVTIDRGQNRFNEQLVEQIHTALDEVLRNPNAKALVTTGIAKFYSNGMDLNWGVYLARTDPERLHRFRSYVYRSLLIRILSFPLPTIALVNGHAFGAGAVMALCHDHVIMQNTRGWWCLYEVHINVRFHPSMLAFFKTRIRSGQSLQEAVILGRYFSSQDAKDAGIVHESCAPEDMYSRALEWVRKVLPHGGYKREHLQTMKEDVYERTFSLRYAPAPKFSAKV